MEGEIVTIDNSQDKGFINVQLRDNGSGLELYEGVGGEYNPFGKTNEDNLLFHVNYENGCIFVNWGKDSDEDVIGYYEIDKDELLGSRVFDKTKSRTIGRVRNGIIYFRRKEADFSVGRWRAEEEVLAYYNESGSIVDLSMVTYLGYIFGNEIGGAAAFIAIFYEYKCKSKFRDFFEMDDDTFKEKYSDYLDPYNYV